MYKWINLVIWLVCITEVFAAIFIPVVRGLPPDTFWVCWAGLCAIVFGLRAIGDAWTR